MDKTVERLYEGLLAAEDLDQFLSENEEVFQDGSFLESLQQVFDQQKMTKAELARRASLSEVFVHQIFSGTRFPSRNKVICLCLAVGLDVKETNRLLALASFATLAPLRRRDCIIMFGLEKGWTVAEINQNLKEKNQQTLD